MGFIKETSQIVWEATGGLIQPRIFLNKGFIVTTMRYQSMPTRMAEIKNTGNMQNPRGEEGTRMPPPCHPAGEMWPGTPTTRTLVSIR